MGLEAWPGGLGVAEPAGDRSTVATFVPWDDPEVDDRGVAVDGPYARMAWLPVLGASSWQVWAAIVDRLALDPEAECGWSDLAPPGASSADVVGHGLHRLLAYRLADRDAAGRWCVRTTCPPLWGRMLARAPSPVHAIHAVTFRPVPGADPSRDDPTEDSPDPGPPVASAGTAPAA